jgi:hypothetical protein
MDDASQEIAPGVFFEDKGNKCCLVIRNKNEEIIAFDYQEVCGDVKAWLQSLQLVAVAIQYGPTVVKDRVKRKKAELKIPFGSLFCNVCDKRFIITPTHPYAFIAKLNNKSYYEFQCSEECNKKRKLEVYSDEIGEDFIKLWETKVYKNSLS